MCLALGLFLVGCYQYTPATFSEVAPDANIRVSLATEKAIGLEEELGGIHRRIDGTLLEKDVAQNAVLLMVPLDRLVGRSYDQSRLQQRIWFEEKDIVLLETRTLNRQRTGLVAGAVATVVGVLLFRALGGGSVDTETEPPPVPTP